MPTRSPIFAMGFQSITFERCSEASFSTMPPWIPRCGLGRVWRLTMLTFSTTTRSFGSTLITVRGRPFSRPVMTTTSSPLRILFMPRSSTFAARSSEHFRRERDDLHELRGAQLAGDRPEDAGADRLELVREQHGGVAVEADQRTVRAAHAEGGAHDDGVVDLALLDLAARDRVLDAHLDDITDGGVAALGAAEHLDAHQALGAAVVGRREHCPHLDHVGCPSAARLRPCRPA